jgi:hypothetical protein
LATLSKVPDIPAPPGYRATARDKRTLGAFLPVFDRILEEDHSAPSEQRLTAIRIDYRLRDVFGYRAGASTARNAKAPTA